MSRGKHDESSAGAPIKNSANRKFVCVPAKLARTVRENSCQIPAGRLSPLVSRRIDTPVCAVVRYNSIARSSRSVELLADTDKFAAPFVLLSDVVLLSVGYESKIRREDASRARDEIIL